MDDETRAQLRLFFSNAEHTEPPTEPAETPPEPDSFVRRLFGATE